MTKTPTSFISNGKEKPTKKPAKKPKNEKYLSIINECKIRTISILTVLGIGLSANTGDSKELPKFKGLTVNPTKQEQISQIPSSLPDTIEIGGRQVKVTYEADGGNIRSDAIESGSKATQEELFTLGEFNNIYKKRWDTISPEEQKKVLYYFNIGKQNNLSKEKIVDLAQYLVSYFYYIQNSINYIKNPIGEYNGGPSKKGLGKKIERIISVGTIFSEKGLEFDNIIKQQSLDTLKKGEDTLKKGEDTLKKGEDTLKKGEDTLKILNETLTILNQIQKSF